MAAKGFFTEHTELEKGGQASVVPHSLCPFTVLVTSYSATRQVVCMHTYPHHLRLPFRPDPGPPLSPAVGHLALGGCRIHPPLRPAHVLHPRSSLPCSWSGHGFAPTTAAHALIAPLLTQQPSFPFQTGGRGYTRQAPWLSLWLTCVVCSNEWMAPLASETRAPESRLHPTD